MKKLTTILFLTAFCFSACNSSANKETSNSAENKTATNQKTANENSASGAGSNETVKKEETPKSAAKTDCLNIKIAGKKIDEKQTFPFDHEPFKNACFVTAHDPEFDDPPLDSGFSIYREGKQVYKFPNQFNGTSGCWAEAVAFQDLNDDGLTDVIIAGLCPAKSAPYSENMVYVNRGKEFTTNEEANYTLEKFKKIKDITDFVKNNKAQFFQ